ncbi:unnamed protein product, partial [Mesorhabditis spiculigera]
MGRQNFGFATLDVKLGSKTTTDEVLAVVRKSTSTIQQASQGLHTLIQALGNDKLKAFQGICGAATVINAILALAGSPDPVKAQLAAIQQQIRTEVDRMIGVIRESFGQLAYKVDYNSFQMSISDHINLGLYNLNRMLTSRNGDTENVFRSWCQSMPPVELANRILSRITGDQSIMRSFMVASDYDFPAYHAFEAKILQQLGCLDILVANYAAFQNEGEQQRQFNELLEVERKIGRQMGAEARLLDGYWPDSARRVVQREIDAGGGNDEIARRVFDKLRRKFSNQWVVAIYNGCSGFDNHCIYHNPDRAFFEWRYNDHNYVVFRSGCDQKSMRDCIIRRIGDIPRNCGSRTVWNQGSYQQGIPWTAERLAGYVSEKTSSGGIKPQMVLAIKWGNGLQVVFHPEAVHFVRDTPTHPCFTYMVGLD